MYASPASSEPTPRRQNCLKSYPNFLSSPCIYPCPDRPTTTKTRILAHSQQMLRTDREERHLIPAEAERNILDCVQEQLDTLNACVLSDYAKGVLTDTLLSSLINLCKEANIPVI